MKLIIQKIDGQVHAYFETEKIFSMIEGIKSRNPGIEYEERISPRDLNHECNLGNYPDNCYFVIEVAPTANRKG